MGELFRANFLEWLNDHPDFIEEEKKGKVLQVVKTKDILENLSISRSTLYRMVKSGKFPAPIKIGLRASGWVVVEVVEWLKSNKGKYKILS